MTSGADESDAGPRPAVQLLTVSGDEAGLRLDRWFRRHFPDLGHGRLEKLLRTGQVRVDGARAQAGARLEAGQSVRIPPLGPTPTAAGPTAPPRARAPRPEDAAAIQASVLLRDADVLVLNKPPGLAVQGGTGTTRHLDAMGEALRFDAAEPPRLVHRLDKDTSGVLVLARTVFAAGRLTAAFRSRDSQKLYCAVTVGVPQPREGRIDRPLAKHPGPQGERMAVDAEEGLSAVTLYRVADEAGRRAALVLLQPLTGRTHQLRVHLASLGTPILGDHKYGGAAAALPGLEVPKGLHLHALRLCLPHPRGGTLTAAAPLPAHMITTCGLLGLTLEGPLPDFLDE